MECERVECVRSSSLEYLEMSGPGGYMMSVSTNSCSAVPTCHKIGLWHAVYFMPQWLLKTRCRHSCLCIAGLA